MMLCAAAVRSSDLDGLTPWKRFAPPPSSPIQGPGTAQRGGVSPAEVSQPHCDPSTLRCPLSPQSHAALPPPRGRPAWLPPNHPEPPRPRPCHVPA